MKLLKYKLSIILPTYNAQDYLMDAINSIINQSIGFENIELIIIDDNSSDNTQSIIKEVAGKYENINAIFMEDNSGSPSRGRNIGIQKSTTDYVMFIDNDDLYASDMCEKMYDSIVSQDVDVVTCKIEQTLNGVPIVTNSFLNDISENYLLKSYEDCPNLVSTGMQMMVWNKIIKKELLWENNIQFPEKDLYEDLYFMLNVYINADGIYLMNDYKGYIYQVRKEEDAVSTSFQMSKNTIFKFFNGFKKIQDTLKDKGLVFPSLSGEMLGGFTKNFLLTDMDEDSQKEIIEGISPYLKSYKINTNLVNYKLLPNILINLGIKIFSIYPKGLIWLSKLLKKI